MSKISAARKQQFTVLSVALVSLVCSLKADAIGSHKVFNVKTYGATGNGTTDDTAGIQAALSAAGSNTGNQVYFPSGTYLISNQLNAAGLVISGQTGAVLTTSSSIIMLRVTGTSPSVSNLSFQSSAGQGAVGVVAVKASNVSLSNLSVGPNFAADVEVTNTSYGSVINNTLTVNTGTFGVLLNTSSGINASSNSISLQSNAATNYGIAETNCQSDTIGTNTISSISGSTNSTGIISQLSTSSQITTNTISGGNAGIITGNDTSPSVTNNAISDTTVQGIHIVQTRGASVSKNNLQNVGLAGDAAILVTDSLGSTTISTNAINGAGHFGIRASGGANITISQNALANVGLTTATAAVIYVDQPNATAISITNNQYKGNTTNVTYFIDSVQPSSITTVAGNKTNTLLPTQVGP